MHLHIGEPQFAQVGGTELNHLKVDPWATVADRLDVELRELAIAPLLRAVITEELRNCRKAYGLRLGAHAVLDVGPNSTSGCLGSKRQGDRIVTTRL